MKQNTQDKQKNKIGTTRLTSWLARTRNVGGGNSKEITYHVFGSIKVSQVWVCFQPCLQFIQKTLTPYGTTMVFEVKMNGRKGQLLQYVW